MRLAESHHRVRRSRRQRLLPTIALAVALAAYGASTGSTTVPLRFELMRGAPLGYFGCFFGISLDHYSCLAARQHAARVNLVFFTGVDLGDGLLASPTIEEASLPLDSLRAVERPSGEGPIVVLDAVLPKVGEIHLRSAAELYTRSSGNEGCPAYAVHYELLGSTPQTVGIVTHDTGTIGGVQVQDLGCNAYFIGPTSGIWWMLGA